MSAGRKPMPQAEPADGDFDPIKLTEQNLVLTEAGRRTTEIADRFAEGLPYERERVIAETRFMMAQSAEAMLEAGKRLIQIKENEPFGEFEHIVENRLGLATRTARRVMAAAAKYLSPALESKRSALAVLGRAKLFDLMAESDDDIEQLAEGGTLAGYTLPALQAMTVREFKQALQDKDQQLVAKDKLLAKRDAKIAKLEEKAELTGDLALFAEIQERIQTLVAATLALGNLVLDLDDKNVKEELRVMINADTEYAAQTFADILQRAGIPVQFEEMVDPSWMKEAMKHRKPGKDA